MLGRLFRRPCGCEGTMDDLRRIRAAYREDATDLLGLTERVERLLKRMRPRRPDGTYMSKEEIAALEGTEEPEEVDAPPLDGSVSKLALYGAAAQMRTGVR